ncbi:kinesin-like protein KIF24 [Acropora palmata]|uniref:kinesin-like protein KIF24 n=1 Tax=Acropora palmata TaxID=6131 RepID=UPI003DA0FD02
MTINLSLYECLQQISLERYHDNFTDRGIGDVGGLLSLTMQDYPTLGISSMADRQNLFYLIQTLKAMQPLPQDRRLDSAVETEGLLRERMSTGKRKDMKSGSKRPREAVENSPTAVKVKTKAHEKIASSARSPSSSRPPECVNNETFYNYGVPSNRPKSSPGKKHFSTPELGQSRIQVCVRKRPMSSDEMIDNEEDVVAVTNNNTVELMVPKVAVDLTKYTQKYQFVFDEAFHEHCTNEDVFVRTAKPLIKTVFKRGKATCFVYGCTGSGKTFTMLGNEEVQGIYFLAAKEIFTILHNGTYGDGLGLWISFYEIYCSQLFDLLNDRARLFAREDANHQVCIAGLTERHVHNVEELMEIIEFGGQVRSTGATGVNADSSRSHAILQLEVKVVNTAESRGRFSFIDLAGCERAADVTDTDKQTRVEGAEINQSLLALKECIRALDLDSKHTPFRQSKLTRVLKDSFVGNCQTCMIANISPNASCSENTLNTLRYANRVKELKMETPVTPIGPRPVTVPTTLPQSDRLLLVTNRTDGLSRVQIQPSKKVVNATDKVSPRKVRTSSIQSCEISRPNTSLSPTFSLSPRTKESVVLSREMVFNNLNEKRKGVVQPCMSRPHTSPDIMTAKGHLMRNKGQKSQLRPFKCIGDDSCQTNAIKIPEERSRLDQDTYEVNNNLKDSVCTSVVSSVLPCTPAHQLQPDCSIEQEIRQLEGRSRRLNSEKPTRDNSQGLQNNNRYGVKTRLAKLFKKGSVGADTLKPGHIPALALEKKASDLSPAEEHFVASHHTHLATVTGLCQEEMVLVQQINNGQKDFKQYMEQLNDILSRKAASILYLQEALFKCNGNR